jgi:hypothetical protein
MYNFEPSTLIFKKHNNVKCVFKEPNSLDYSVDKKVHAHIINHMYLICEILHHHLLTERNKIQIKQKTLCLLHRFNMGVLFKLLLARSFKHKVLQFNT